MKKVVYFAIVLVLLLGTASAAAQAPTGQPVDLTKVLPPPTYQTPRGGGMVPAGGTQAVLDDFNRGDGPIGAGWTIHDGSCNVVSNAATCTNSARATFNGASSDGNAAEIDVAVFSTALDYQGLLLNYGAGVSNIMIKVQNQSGGMQFGNAACYTGNNGGGFGLGFFALSSPFGSAHMKVTRVGNDVTIEFTNIDGGAQPPQTYVCSGAPAPEGTGIGINGYSGLDRVDNFGGPGEPPMDPDIEVNPTSLYAEQCADEVTTQTLQICNVGGGELTWSLSEQPPVKAVAGPTRDTDLGRTVELKLDAAGGGSVATNPPTVDAPVSLVLDDGSRENDIGIGGTLEMIWLNRFTPSPADFPFDLTQVQVYFSTIGLVNIGDQMRLVIYENTSGNNDPAVGSNLLATFDVTVGALDTWNVYDLPAAVTFNGPGDALIGVIGLEVPGTSYWPASIDQTASQQRSWAGWWNSSPPPVPPVLPPPNWTLIDAYFPGNWMVRGYGETGGAPDIPWLGEDPTGGTIPAGDCVDVTATFDSAGLVPADYFGDLVIDSNDPDEPTVTVPAQMTVLNCAAEPDIEVTPASLLAEQCPDLQTQQTLDVCNVGGADLTWTLGEMVPPKGPQAVLWDNGPLVTHPAACSGMDASRLQTDLGMNTLGFGHQFPLGYRMADDFTVADPAGWDVQQITFFAYQSTAPLNPSPIAGVYYQIWNGPPNDPGSSVVYGDLVTNRLLSSANPNLQRDSGTGPCANNRYIFADVAGAGVLLPPGTYWLDWTTEGNPAYSGPWAPPITILGQTTTGNGMQYTTAWAAALDTGTSTPQDLPFIIEGEAGGPPPDIPWLSENPTSGTVLPGQCAQVTVTFDSTGLAPGDYFGDLVIDSNDPDEPQVVVPVQLTVEECAENTMHINRMRMNWRLAGQPGFVKVIALVRIYDQNGAPVVGAEVFGDWTYPDGSVSPGVYVLLTDDLGRTKFRVKEPWFGDYEFCVTGMTLAGYVYDPNANEDGPCVSATTMP